MGSGWVGPPGYEPPQSGAMFTRTYKGRSQAAAAGKMQDDLNRPGYQVVGQSWASGGRSCAAQGFVVVGIAFLLMGLLFPPLWAIAVVCLVIGLVSGRTGELTVTWAPIPQAPRPVAPQPAPVPAPAAAPDHVANLTTLKSMLDQGLITPEEYEAKKADLLSRM